MKKSTALSLFLFISLLFALVCGCSSADKQASCSHSFTSWSVTTPATCASSGLQTRQCQLCGLEENFMIPKVSHKYGKWNTIEEPTCVSEGTKCRICSLCQNSEESTIALLDHAFGDWAIIKNPTCTSVGTQARSCSICTKVEESSIPILEHQYGEWNTTKEPTCVSEGTKCRICSLCQNSEESTVALLDHAFGDWAIIKNPTCTSVGTQARSCSVCTKVEELSIPIIEHQYGEWRIVSAPSCTSLGTKERKCANCTHVETDSINTIDHSPQWVVTKEATRYAEGERVYVCTQCSVVFITEAIPQITYSETEIKQSLQQSVFKIYNYDYDKTTLISQGTGFFIDNMGYFVTNAHVMEGAYYSEIKTYLGGTYEVDKICYYNYHGTDLAICHAQNVFSSPVEFADSASVGDTVFALGYPNDSFTLQMTTGQITSECISVDGKTYYENTANIDHGSSGGILVNTDGKVIGITTASLGNGNFAAIRYKDVKFTVDGIHISGETPLEYFHDVEEVRISMLNADKYFDIYVSASPSYDGRNVDYTIAVQLKEKYRNKKFYFESSSVYIGVEIETTFSYYQNGYSRRKTDYYGGKTLYFYSESSATAGQIAHSTSFSNVYSADGYISSTYTTDIGLCSGTIVFID